MNNNYREDYQGYRDFLMHGFGGGGFVSKAIRRYQKRHAGGDDSKDNRVSSFIKGNKSNDSSSAKRNSQGSRTKIVKTTMRHYNDLSNGAAKIYVRMFGQPPVTLTANNISRLQGEAMRHPENAALQELSEKLTQIWLYDAGTYSE